MIRSPTPVAARRKIARVRGPVALAAVELRARLDPEYLGLSLVPGQPAGRAELEEDLAVLDAPPEVGEAIDRLTSDLRRDRQRLALESEGGFTQRVSEAAGLEELDAKRLRALGVGYLVDLDGLRSHLSCQAILEEVAVEAQRVAPISGGLMPRPAEWRRFRRWWKQRPAKPAEPNGEPPSAAAQKAARKAAWRAVRADRQGARRALEVWSRLGPEKARARAEAIAADIVRHPSQVTEPLVTLRAVQTLSRIDLECYEEHVWRLAGL